MSEELPDPPQNPGPTPSRRPGSVRRTSAILMHWPDGFGTQLRLDGRARDLFTPEQGEPIVLREDALTAGVGVDRTIEKLTSEPPHPRLAGLVGVTCGGGSRLVVDECVADERDAGTPLYLLLDDVAAATLIAPFAWSQSADDWMERAAERIAEGPKDGAHRLARRRMEGICAGFRPGSSALAPDGTVNLGMRHNVADVPPLVAPDDPLGWHELTPHPRVAMRRARRIDVWLEDAEVVVDAMFRDSCWRPDGAEVAVHEYCIDARIDQSGALVQVDADPRVLPYPECPAAAPNASWMEGATVRELRREVLERLRGVDCCTHLNDALRSLAEVPVLVPSLART